MTATATVIQTATAAIMDVLPPPALNVALPATTTTTTTKTTAIKTINMSVQQLTTEMLPNKAYKRKKTQCEQQQRQQQQQKLYFNHLYFQQANRIYHNNNHNNVYNNNNNNNNSNGNGVGNRNGNINSNSNSNSNNNNAHNSMLRYQQGQLQPGSTQQPTEQQKFEQLQQMQRIYAKHCLVDYTHNKRKKIKCQNMNTTNYCEQTIDYTMPRFNGKRAQQKCPATLCTNNNSNYNVGGQSTARQTAGRKIAAWTTATDTYSSGSSSSCSSSSGNSSRKRPLSGAPRYNDPNYAPYADRFMSSRAKDKTLEQHNRGYRNSTSSETTGDDMNSSQESLSNKKASPSRQRRQLLRQQQQQQRQRQQQQQLQQQQQEQPQISENDSTCNNGKHGGKNGSKQAGKIFGAEQQPSVLTRKEQMASNGHTKQQQQQQQQQRQAHPNANNNAKLGSSKISWRQPSNGNNNNLKRSSDGKSQSDDASGSADQQQHQPVFFKINSCNRIKNKSIIRGQGQGHGKNHNSNKAVSWSSGSSSAVSSPSDTPNSSSNSSPTIAYGKPHSHKVTNWRSECTGGAGAGGAGNAAHYFSNAEMADSALDNFMEPPLQQYAKVNLMDFELVQYLRRYVIDNHLLRVYGFPVESVLYEGSIEIFKCHPYYTPPLAAAAAAGAGRAPPAAVVAMAAALSAATTTTIINYNDGLSTRTFDYNESDMSVVPRKAAKQHSSCSASGSDGDADADGGAHAGEVMVARDVATGISQASTDSGNVSPRSVDTDASDWSECEQNVDSAGCYEQQTLAKQCSRCKSQFLVDEVSGDYLTQDECVFHWGKFQRYFDSGVWLAHWTCCNGESDALGCAVHELHVWSGSVVGMNGPYNDFVHTVRRSSDPVGDDEGASDLARLRALNELAHRSVYALDCEMSYTARGLDVTKVSLVGIDGLLVYEHYVRPDAEVIDFNTRFSGVTERHLMGKGVKSLSEVQRDLVQLIDADTILIGHGLENDLRALRLVHKTLIDTSITFPHHSGFPYRRALRQLVQTHLKRQIQSEEGKGHSSFEDSRACMELMLWRVRKELDGTWQD